MKVTDPEGQVWRVSRRWLPWRVRLRDLRDHAPNPISGGGDIDDLLVGILFWVAFLVIAAVVPIVLSLLFLPLEVLALVIVLPLAVIGRITFGRKWHVELRRGWRPWTEVEAGRWREATLTIHQLADAVRRGDIPASTIATGNPAWD